MTKTKKLLLALTLGVFLLPATSLAAKVTCPSGYQLDTAKNACVPTGTTVQQKLSNNPITNDINDFVTFLTGLVGIVAVGNIIAGGIQYTAAGGNPQMLASARKRIANAILALVAFLLIWAFVQWLVPGGVFG